MEGDAVAAEEEQEEEEGTHPRSNRTRRRLQDTLECSYRSLVLCRAR